MTKTELFKLHREVCDRGVALMKKKNADYSNGSDPFRNFRRHGTFGVLVRLSDKLARLESFEEKGSFAVRDESLEDTVTDLVNYCVIYLAMKAEGKRKT